MSVLSAPRAGARRHWLLLGCTAPLAAVALGWVTWWSLVRPGRSWVFDLRVYLAVGRAVWAGHPAYLAHNASGYGFTYPPFAALPSAVVALLPTSVAAVCWDAAVVAVVALLAARLTRAVVPRRRAWLVLAVFALALVSQPVRVTLRFGQVEVFLLALVVADLSGWLRRLPRGVLIGLATAVKWTPAVFIPYLWFTGRRRAAGWAFGVAVGGQLVAWLLLPHDARAYFTRFAWDDHRFGDLAGTGNQSIRGMLLRAGLGSHHVLLPWAVLAAAVVLFALWRSVRRGAADPFGAAAVLGCASVAASPVSWTHHLVWVLLGLGLLAARGGRRSRVAAAVGVVIMVGNFPIWGHRLLHVAALPHAVGDLVTDLPALLAIALVAVVPLRARTAPAMSRRGHPPLPRLHAARSAAPTST